MITGPNIARSHHRGVRHRPDRRAVRPALGLPPAAPRRQRRAEPDAHPQLREHGAEALCRQPARPEVQELPSPLIDMGSGPGLPGIPLKIARPEVEMILAEPRGARAEFLRRGPRRGSKLEEVEVFAGKVGPEVPEDGRRGDHPGRRVDPRDARPRGELPRAGRSDALHEGPGLRRRDRRGASSRTPRPSGWSPTTPTRSPARRTTAGS